MKIGSVDSCPKKLNRVLKRQQAEIEFLKDFLKSFETMRPHRRLPSGEEKLRLLKFLAKRLRRHTKDYRTCLISFLFH
jgi:hypothetical protein